MLIREKWPGQTILAVEITPPSRSDERPIPDEYPVEKSPTILNGELSLHNRMRRILVARGGAQAAHPRRWVHPHLPAEPAG